MFTPGILEVIVSSEFSSRFFSPTVSSIISTSSFLFFLFSAFFFQAEDGIRDWSVTGVQTCALPISSRRRHRDWSVTGVQTCALPIRSEEHTSELQSLTNLVCRLLNPARARNAS